MPYVRVTAEITPTATDLEHGDGTRISQEQAPAWTAATSWWPASDAVVKQTAGWLSGEGAGGGHVWAQAYISGKGWVSVDCTSDHVGADTSYLPFFETYDGAMPIVYVRSPA